MDPALLRSLLAAGMLFLGLAVGYGARLSGLVRERWGRPLHLLNIVAFQANITWLTMWDVKWEWSHLRLPVTGLLISLIMTFTALGLARLLRLDRRDRGTFALSAGMSNLGSTGGLLVLRVLISDAALKWGMVYLLYWTFFAFLFCFPVARHFGSETRLGLRRLVLESVIDIRMLPFAGMMVGLGLSAWAPARPAVVERIVYYLVLASGFTAMFAIGVTVHLRKVREFLPTFFVQAGVKFILGPAAAALLVLVMGFHGEMAQAVFVMSAMSQAFYSVMIANLFNLNVHMANSMFLVNTLTFLVVVFPALAVLVGG